MANIGDLVPKAGMYTDPGVVVDKQKNGNVKISTEPMDIHKFHRYTNTTGLSLNEKNTFNKILDEIYKKEDPVERINDIQSEIDRLKTDPEKRNIVQYLRNQQATLIRETRELPDNYTWNETDLPD